MMWPADIVDASRTMNTFISVTHHCHNKDLHTIPVPDPGFLERGFKFAKVVR